MPSRSPEDGSSGKVTVTFKDREFGKTAKFSAVEDLILQLGPYYGS
jgi:hypothetical protein